MLLHEHISSVYVHRDDADQRRGDGVIGTKEQRVLAASGGQDLTSRHIEGLLLACIIPTQLSAAHQLAR